MSKLQGPAGRLYKFKLPDLLGSEGACLPEAYKKFYREWKLETPSPVHYMPVNAKWIRNDVTGEVKRVENIPIPLKFPPESHKGLWGGEGVIKGFQKRDQYRTRIPHFWVPNLKKSAVYSEILDKTFSVTVTERTIDLIIDNQGFDNYLLKTKACDIQSTLGLKMKQKMLQSLMNKDLYPNDPVKREKVYNKYKHFLLEFNREEIEWYGLTFDEALHKQKKLDAIANAPKPLKHTYRQQLLSKLVEDLKTETDREAVEVTKESSWLSKLNPFSKSS